MNPAGCFVLLVLQCTASHISLCMACRACAGRIFWRKNPAVRNTHAFTPVALNENALFSVVRPSFHVDTAVAGFKHGQRHLPIGNIRKESTIENITEITVVVILSII